MHPIPWQLECAEGAGSGGGYHGWHIPRIRAQETRFRSQVSHCPVRGLSQVTSSKLSVLSRAMATHIED